MSSGEPMKVLMDVDTGVDDAMALAMAVVSPEIDLIGVTTVAGNVTRDQATANTLRVLDYLGAHSTPVYAGMNWPLTRSHFDATSFHGHDGLGGAPIPSSERSVESITAPEFIVSAARRHAGDITFIFVGPLTNLAVALGLEPKLPELVTRTVIMGGAFDVPGNTTSWAEFNIAVDPEAAMVVAESGLNATWVGLDVTHQVKLTRADWDALDGNDSPPAALVREVCRLSFERRNLEAIHLHDPLTVGAVLDPSVVECERTAVWVDTSVSERAGATRMVTDSRAPQHEVARKVDQESFRQAFGRTLGLQVGEMPARG